MTAAVDIRTHAKMFGWECHCDPKRDTFIHGPHMVAVDYNRAGAVDRAQRYFFHRVTDPRLQESAPGRHKKTTVVAWLVSLGH